MGNKESYLRVPPKQSSFGPWFYHADEQGLGDKAFVGVTAFFVTFAAIELVLLFGLISEVLNVKNPKKRKEFINRSLVRYFSIFFMIFLGWAILGSSFSYTWRQDSITGNFPYRIGLAEHVPMRLGLHVGLRGINITLVYTGTPGTNRFSPRDGYTEIIQYNEQYLWSRGQGNIGGWLIGRFGFGPYSNLLAQQFRQAQFRGTPIPIVETLEWLTLDGESIRWHRWYHVGGYYAHVCLWLAFVTWIVTAITTVMHPPTGMFWLGMTGFLMWFGAALYHGITKKAHPDLAIHFDEEVLQPTFGWAYYLTLIVGIIVNLIAVCGFYLFKKLEYTTDAFSLTLGAFEKPTDIVRTEPKPLEQVLDASGPVPTRSVRSGVETGTFRRARSTFGSRRVSTRSDGLAGSVGAGSVGPARGESKFGGRSSRRTKKAFGKRIDGSALAPTYSSSLGHPTKASSAAAPTLASLGSRLDTLDEVEMDTFEEVPEEVEEAPTSTTEV